MVYAQGSLSQCKDHAQVQNHALFLCTVLWFLINVNMCARYLRTTHTQALHETTQRGSTHNLHPAVHIPGQMATYCIPLWVIHWRGDLREGLGVVQNHSRSIPCDPV